MNELTMKKSKVKEVFEMFKCRLREIQYAAVKEDYKNHKQAWHDLEDSIKVAERHLGLIHLPHKGGKK